MKITFARTLQNAAKTIESTAAPAAVKTPVTITPKSISNLPKKTALPTDMWEVGNGAIPGGLGQSIPGLGKNGLPGEISKNGFPGKAGFGLPGFDKSGFRGIFGKEGLPGIPGNNSRGIEGILGGLGKNGLGGIGKGIFGNGTGLGSDGFGFGKGIPGMEGFLGGFGKKGGPAIKMPGSDRMGGDTSLGAIFGKGRWDYGPNGFTASGSFGATSHGYGVGVNEKGEVGVAKGDHEGGSVTSMGDAQGAANSAVNGGGGSNKNTGVPEGMDWSKGTTIKDSSKSSAGDAKKTEGPNDLGPSTNDPSTEEKKENETAVAQNDATKNNQAGKPNPYATPNPEDSGGGTPRSNVGSSAFFTPNPEDPNGGTPRSNIGASAFFTPNPDDPNGGTPRSRSSALGSLIMPNPEDSGGGTPRSVSANIAHVTANIAMKLRG